MRKNISENNGKRPGSVKSRFLVSAFAVFLVAYSQTGISSEEVLEQYKSLFAQQQKEFEKQRQIIIEQGREIEKLKSRLDSLITTQSTDRSPASNVASKDGQRPPQVSSSATPKTVVAGPVDKKPIRGRHAQYLVIFLSDQ